MVPPTQLAPNAPPAPRGLATAAGNLVLDVPVSERRVTAILYHGVGSTQVVPLTPLAAPIVLKAVTHTPAFAERLRDMMKRPGDSA